MCLVCDYSDYLWRHGLCILGASRSLGPKLKTKKKAVAQLGVSIRDLSATGFVLCCIVLCCLCMHPLGLLSCDP